MSHSYDQPLFTITSAIIPNADNPAQYVRDQYGHYPSVIHEDGERTWEESFQKFGKEIVGRYVGVERRATDLERGRGHIVYVGKSVTAAFPPDSPYQWHEG